MVFVRGDRDWLLGEILTTDLGPELTTEDSEGHRGRAGPELTTDGTGPSPLGAVPRQGTRTRMPDGSETADGRKWTLISDGRAGAD